MNCLPPLPNSIELSVDLPTSTASEIPTTPWRCCVVAISYLSSAILLVVADIEDQADTTNAAQFDIGVIGEVAAQP